MGIDTLGKKDEDEQFFSFASLDKAAVLQQTKIFSSNHLNSKQCSQLLMKILYLLYKGEKLTSNEATEVFFGVTKLFQSNDQRLRRLVYMFIKEMTSTAEEVIIVTNCLTKDMTSTNEMYRANAVRVLSKIVDSAMLGQIERYIKQAIVDKNGYVSSCALASAIHLYKKNPQIVSRWLSEVSQACTSNSPVAQFQAYCLYYMMKQNDPLAITRLVTASSPSSTFVDALLVRFTAQVAQDEIDGDEIPSDAKCLKHLQNSLQHYQAFTVIEAARAIANLDNPPKTLLKAVCEGMGRFLDSYASPIKKFAAVRILHTIAIKHSGLDELDVWMPSQLQEMISDSNRSLATLAITTLLKTGVESSINKLLKHLNSFVAEIPDEFKISVVEALSALCAKYPRKHRAILSFMTNILRDEGGFEFKRTVVEAIHNILNEVPQANEAGLLALCEFIEDCEFSALATRVIDIIATWSSKSSDPKQYVRFLYNRLVLENASVRVAAIMGLAKYAFNVPSMKPQVLKVLRRCQKEDNDDVRDRASAVIALLSESSEETAKSFLVDKFPYPVENMVESLEEYLGENATFDQPFEIDSVSLMEKVVAQAEEEEDRPSAKPGPMSEQEKAASGAAAEDRLREIAEEFGLGRKVSSSRPQQLTEEGTEYVVVCTKHAFENHLVLQLSLTNTLEEQLLENVRMEATLDFDGLVEEHVVPCEKLPFSATGSSFIVYSREEGEYPTGSATNTLKFVVKDIDTSTGEAESHGFDDEYAIEDLEFSVSDYICRVSPPQFMNAWENLGDSCQVEQSFTLPHKTIKDSLTAVVEYLGLKACDGTDTVPAKARAHTLLLSGIIVPRCQVMAQVQFARTPSGIGMDVSIRSQSTEISDLLISNIS
eukprot:Rmarinus@m.24789